MKVLCIVDFPIREGYRWLWSHLPPNEDEVDFCFPERVPADRFAKWGKLLGYYPAYWQLARRALVQTRRKAYDVVLAYEGKNGLPYVFLRRLAGQRRPRVVIQYFSVKGVVMHFLPLARYAMGAVDQILVPSHGEIDYYAELLGWPEERSAFLPIGNYDPYGGMQPQSAQARGYVFAGGRSDRDYRTFLEAASGLDSQVIVNTRPFAVRGLRLPANVQVNDMTPLDRLGGVMTHARFVVVPLAGVRHAAGLSQIVLAMSAARAVIATRAGGSEDYVEAGRTGLLVEPGNAVELRRAMQYLLDNPAEAERMGREGRARYEERHTFAKMAENVRSALLQVCSRTM